MRMWRIATPAAVLTLLLAAVPAAASCALPIPIDQALRDSDSVFVGTVEGLANGGRTASFLVDEVWRGPDLPARTAVAGGPEGSGVTSIDRSWEPGAKYLVFASVVNGKLADNACSNTQIWSDDLAALRPSDARPAADPSESTTPGLPGPLLIVVGVVAAVGLVSFLAFRSRPPSA